MKRSRPARLPGWARVLVILSATAAGVLFMRWLGEWPVIPGSQTWTESVHYWYMLAAFPVLGMLAADFLDLALSGQRLQAAELEIMLVILVLVSFIRLANFVPVSGHMLLLTYFLVRRLLLRSPAHAGQWLEWGIVLGLCVPFIYLKLAWWDDSQGLFFGVLFGAGLAVISTLLVKYVIPDQAQKK